MTSRSIAFLLAVLLFWTALSTIEAPRAFAHSSSEQLHAVVLAVGHAAAHEDSVENHHLDDLPSQTQADPPAETLGMLPAPLGSGAPLLTLSRPHQSPATAADSPFLSGLLRPPCSAAVTA